MAGRRTDSGGGGKDRGASRGGSAPVTARREASGNGGRSSQCIRRGGGAANSGATAKRLRTERRQGLQSCQSPRGSVGQKGAFSLATDGRSGGDLGGRDRHWKPAHRRSVEPDRG